MRPAWLMRASPPSAAADLSVPFASTQLIADSCSKKKKLIADSLKLSRLNHWIIAIWFIRRGLAAY